MDELIAKLKRRVDETDTELLSDLLDEAKGIILARRFPFADTPQELPEIYQDLQLRVAVNLYYKIGAEGQKAHSENGISRTYDSLDEILQEIVPVVKT